MYVKITHSVIMDYCLYVHTCMASRLTSARSYDVALLHDYIIIDESKIWQSV